MVSKEEAIVLAEEELDNVYSKLEILDEAGLIKIYRYPTRPKIIPIDDSDLLNKTIHYIERSDEPPIGEDFTRLILLYPNLLDKVNSYCVGKIENFEPFKKEDLIDILKDSISRQIENPNREYFIESAKIQICNTYPELRDSVVD